MWMNEINWNNEHNAAYKSYWTVLHMCARCINMYGYNSHQAARLRYISHQMEYAYRFPQFA
jgi:hypothetical protein